LGPLVRISDLPGRRRLHSASTNRLVVPPFKLLLAEEHLMMLLLEHGTERLKELYNFAEGCDIVTNIAHFS